MAGEGAISNFMSAMGRLGRGITDAAKRIPIPEAIKRFPERMAQQRDLHRQQLQQARPGDGSGDAVQKGRKVGGSTQPADIGRTGANGTGQPNVENTPTRVERGRGVPGSQPAADPPTTPIPPLEANPLVAAGVDGRNIGQRDDSRQGAPQGRTAPTDAGNPTAPKAAENIGGRGDQTGPVDGQMDQQDSPNGNKPPGYAPPAEAGAFNPETGELLSVDKTPTQPLSRLADTQPAQTATVKTPLMEPASATETPTEPPHQSWDTIPSEQPPAIAQTEDPTLPRSPGQRTSDVAVPGTKIAKMLEGRTPLEQQAFNELPRDWQQKIAELQLPPEQLDKMFEAIMRYDSDTRQALANFFDGLTPEQRARFIENFVDMKQGVVDWIKDIQKVDLQDGAKRQEIIANAPKEVEEWLQKITGDVDTVKDEQFIEEIKRYQKIKQELEDMKRKMAEEETRRSTESQDAKAAQEAQKAKDDEENKKRNSLAMALLIAEFAVMFLGLGRLSESSVG